MSNLFDMNEFRRKRLEKQAPYYTKQEQDILLIIFRYVLQLLELPDDEVKNLPFESSVSEVFHHNRLHVLNLYYFTFSHLNLSLRISDLPYQKEFETFSTLGELILDVKSKAITQLNSN